MRKLQNLTKLALCAALVAPLVGCSGDGEGAVEQVGDAKEMFGCNVINVFNAGEYIGEGVISNFETMYNAKVNYDMFESNEMMYTKLLGGSSYAGSIVAFISESHSYASWISFGLFVFIE